MISMLRATNEATASSTQVEVRNMDKDKIDGVVGSEEKECMHYVGKSEVLSSKPLKKSFVLHEGTYALAIFNKNKLHMSYLSCRLRIGHVDMRFDLRRLGNVMQKVLLIKVENKQALLEVDMECMQLLKAVAGIDVGKVKFGFILKQVPAEDAPQ